MTIGQTSVCVTYQGGTEAIDFEVPFEVLDKGDVHVAAWDRSGTAADFVEGLDYYVEILQPAGESKSHRLNQRMQTMVRLSNPLPEGWRLHIRRRVDITQDNSLQGMHFNAVEDSLDKLTMICQETSYDLGVAGDRADSFEKRMDGMSSALQGEDAVIRAEIVSLRSGLEKNIREIEEYLDAIGKRVERKMPTAPGAGVWLGQGGGWVTPTYWPGIVGGDEAMGLPMYYNRSERWSGSAAVLLSPSAMIVDVGGQLLQYAGEDGERIDLSVEANWDKINWVTPANRAGRDFYIYVWQQPGVTRPACILSNNSTIPEGERFSAGNTRKIGGFHCLFADVGTIAGHPLSGMATGQIIPASVWDLRHRPIASPEGMVYVKQIGKWVQIYIMTTDGTGNPFTFFAQNNNMSALYGYTPLSKYWCVAFLADRNMRLLADSEFQAVAQGSNTGVVSNDGVGWRTGGHKDVTGRRMISSDGVEDCCGIRYQWVADNACTIAASQTYTATGTGNGSVVLSGGAGILAGGWGAGDSGLEVGPVCRMIWFKQWDTPQWWVGCRGCSDPLVSF